MGGLRASTGCDVGILTTASITGSAPSAIWSGPRAKLAVGDKDNPSAAAAQVANMVRRSREVASKVPIMGIFLLGHGALRRTLHPCAAWCKAAAGACIWARIRAE